MNPDSKTETEVSTQSTSANKRESFLGPISRLIVSVLLITTLLSLASPHHWFADLLANLRMQQMIGLLVAFTLCLWLANRKSAFHAFFLIALHLPWFAPALPPSVPHQQIPRNAESQSITITFANALTSNWNVDAVATDLVRNDPDVIVVLELSSILQAKIENEISAAYPHSIARPLDRSNFGIGLYSQHPLNDQDVFRLNLEIESIAATIQISDQSYRIVATHPLPPMSAIGFEHRNQHLKQLADRMNTLQDKSPSTHVILVGDLNLTPWSPIFADFEQRSGLRQARAGFSVTPTWYQFPIFPLGLMLDHGLISQDIHCVSHQVGPDIGSDHRSVTLEVHAKR